MNGFFEYDGEHKVLGDGNYTFGDTFYNSYYDEIDKITYIVYGKFDMGRKITEIRFDILLEDNSSIRNTIVFNYISINEVLTELEDYIVYDLVTFTELYESLSDLHFSAYDGIDDLEYINIDALIKVIEDFVPVK